MAKDVTARVTRSEGWWAISVEEIPGLFTQARREAEEKQRISSGLTREVIRRFRDEGLTLRDIASLVGLSQQRVAVLSKDV